MPVLNGWVGHEVDVAVIGAGAAGVGAARHLARCRPDLALVVVEADRRLGGRALTLAGDLPVDLGCGWLHGARDNVWTALAGEFGFAVEKTPAPWSTGKRRFGLPAGEAEDASAALQRFFERVETRAAGDADRALDQFLEADGPWNGLIGAIGTFINGVELDRASAIDYDRYEPGRPPDWRVREGYGRLIAAVAAALPVVLDTAVQRIVHHGISHIAVETTRGTLRARHVIVTVSSNLIASEAIRFDPPLSGKREAAASLPLGLANKLFLSVAGSEDLPDETHLLGRADRVDTAAYQIRPFGRPVIECYFGGQLAHWMERAGPDAALDFVKQELGRHFGASIQPRLSLLATSAWGREPWTRGSYSYAKPGEADARSVLAFPVDHRIFFAGEACSPARFSTAHGAYESGVAAADQVVAAL